MPPPGALADKIGNRYEGRIAVWRILQLLDEQHDSVRARFEKPGDDKFEWWVEREDGSRTYTQVKRQQSVDDEWSVGTLVSRGVLPAFGERLAEEPAARCEFFSALSASHLLQLSEDARMADSLSEFEAEFARSEAKKASWEKIRGAWPGASTPEQAWLWLRRVTAGNMTEPDLRDTLHARAPAMSSRAWGNSSATTLRWSSRPATSGTSCALRATGRPTGAGTEASTPGSTTRPPGTGTGSPLTGPGSRRSAAVRLR
jgi:hypothetical protein